MEHQPVGPVAYWEQDAPVHNTLALLSRQSVLIAVTLQLWVAGRQFDITVSKALDEAGQWVRQYWWEVDRLTEAGRSGPKREKRWALGLRSYDTAEAAYEAAVEAVGASTGVTAPPV